MTARTKGALVLAVQMLLVLSIAAKYAWERHTCPRVWTRAVQFDPQQPIRGRYLALNLRADACGLPQTASQPNFSFNYRPGPGTPKARTWTVTPIAKNGKLSALVADPANLPDAPTLTLPDGIPCEAALLSAQSEFFIADDASTPFPLHQGEELWAEVTVPPSGPPRPIHLALSDGKQFYVLNLR